MAPPEILDRERPEMPEGFDPEKMKPDMEGMTPPADFNGSKMDFERNENGTITLPDGTAAESPLPEGNGHGGRGPGSGFGDNMPNQAIALSEVFTISAGANYFNFIGFKE